MKSSTTAWIVALSLMATGVIFLPRLLSTHIEVPAPTQATGDPPLVGTTTSQIQIEFTVALSAIEAALNQEMQPYQEMSGVVHDPTDALSEDTINWNLSLGHVRIRNVKNVLSFEVPFSGKARLHGRIGVKRKNKGLLGKLEEALGATFSETPSFAGVVRGTLQPRFRPDWTLDPGLSLELDLSKAESQLFGKAVKFSFRDYLQGQVNGHIGSLIPKFNESLARSNALRNHVAKGWTGLHLVTSVFESPAVWISLHPLALGASNPVVVDDALVIDVAANVSSAVHVGGNAPTVAARELPAMTPLAATGGDFAVAIPIALALSDFHNISIQDLGLSDTVEVPQGEIEIEKLYLLGDAGQLYVGAEVVADLGWFERTSATLYFSGRPTLDKSKNELRIDDLQYELKTKNVLVSSANYFLQPVLLERLRKLAVFDLNIVERDVLEKSDIEVSKLTASLPSGIQLEFNVADLDLSEFIVDEGWLVAVVRASGPARVRVENIEGLVAKVRAPDESAGNLTNR